MKKYRLKYIATAILIISFLVYARIDLAKENKEYNILNKVYERINR